MLARAEQIKASKGGDADNVTFVKGVITAVPLDAGIADCIISNCVINLVPAAEKPLVFREMHRLLRPGGRVAVSDILAKRPLPQELINDMAMYVGCIAGASEVAEYDKWLREAGFGGASSPFFPPLGTYLGVVRTSQLIQCTQRSSSLTQRPT